MTASNVYEQGLTLTAGGSVSLSSFDLITNTSGAALQISAGADTTLINAGTIAGGGAYGQGLYLLGGGTLINSGTITGAYAASVLGPATVINSGAILGGSGPRDSGLYLGNGGAVRNAADGVLAGSHAGVELVRGGTVVNFGQIQGSGSGGYGVLGLGGGKLFNDGTIAATAAQAAGVRFAGTYGYVTNLGTILGDRAGVELAAGGVVAVAPGAVVAGTDAGVSLANGKAMLFNFGTVAGAEAVSVAPGQPTLVDLYPSGTFVGTVDGGNKPGDTIVSYLELGAGTQAGTLSGLGSQFVDFSYIYVRAGGDWTLADTARLAAGVTLHDQGRLTLATPLHGPGTVSLAAGVTLSILPGDAPSGVVAGLGSAAIDFVGAKETVAGYAGGVLSLTGDQNISLYMIGSSGDTFVARPDANGGTVITACFAAGSGVLGPDGWRKVEELHAGDLVVTASGRIAALRWVGSRRIDMRRHARAGEVAPIRVRAGAFGPETPMRDLVLSPDHAVLVDGVLIPIRHLANGRSIATEAWDEVTYFHLELDRHDALVVEGLVCESYLDTGNRHAFEGEAALALHPDFSAGAEAEARATWSARGCADIATAPSDPRLRAAHLRLAARAMLPSINEGATRAA
ncbi:MAG: Hint domain-containing protein [Rhodospirillales bacterium]|nr:Hint domain-containing protein [Rhodospirillales bacterium]